MAWPGILSALRGIMGLTEKSLNAETCVVTGFLNRKNSYSLTLGIVAKKNRSGSERLSEFPYQL